MSLNDDDVEELLSQRPGRVEPRRGFEEEVLARLISTQRRRPRVQRVGYADHPAETLSAAARNVLLAITACGAAAAIAIALGAQRQVVEPAPRVDLEVAERKLEAPANEPLRERLADGSVVFLDAGARATVVARRTIRLERGRAFVEVAPLGAAFRVLGPAGVAVAHGTKLAVEAQAGGLLVAVAQGRVSLEGEKGALDLAPGEAGELLPGKAPETVPARRVSHVVSWLREVYGRDAAPVLVKEKRPGFGDLVAIDPEGPEARLSVRRLHVDVHVEDGVARTTIDTTYFNHMSWRLEGTFYFPVPPGASITRLAMYVDGKLMEGGVAEREQARAAYEQIVYKKRDPALLEWMEGNVFKMRIFPLEARQEKRVIVSFVQELDSLYGTLRYALPLDAGKEECKSFSVSMRLKGAASRRAESPTYDLAPSRDGDDLLLRLERTGFAPKKDLVVYLEDPGLAPASCVDSGHSFVHARFRPSLGGKREGGGRSVVVLYDVSGSRGKLDLAVQREVLGRLLSELDDTDRVEMIALNTRVRPWAHGWQPARTAGAEAQAFVDSVRAIGGTDLGAGLAEAGRAVGTGSRGLVVYLGDGVATLGEKDPLKLALRLPSGTAFVGIGTGKKVDAPLLESLAGATGGTCTFLNGDEPIAWRVFDLVAALSTPRLVGLGVSAVDSTGRTVEGSLHLSRTVAADGEEVRVVGRFETAPARLVLSGKLAGEAFETTLLLSGAREGALYLPRLWARGRVERLLREGAEKNKAEIVALGKESFIATPFTSLLVLENDEMYTQLKVERGKPDRFAFYETPEKIEVVTEPFPGQPATPGHSKNMRELLASIAQRQQELVYSPYGYIADYELSSGGTGLVVDAIQRDFESDRMDPTRPPPSPYPALRDLTTLPEFRNVNDGRFFPYFDGIPDWAGATNLSDLSPVGALIGPPLGQVSYNVITREPLLNEGAYARLISRDPAWLQSDGYSLYCWFGVAPTGGLDGIRDFTAIDALSRGAYYWPGRTCSLNPNATWDLTLLVPALRPTRADALALAERELSRELAAGHLDAASLALLEKARSVFGLRRIELADGTKGTASGDGRLSLVRKLPWDLEEQVFVDGTMIHQVYPELGIAVRRPLSRFHAADLAALMPFLPPSAASLVAWDATTSGRTVTLVPAGAKAPAFRIELDFAEDGRLAERRELRRRDGAWKVVFRVSIGADFKLTIQTEVAKPCEVAVQSEPLDASKTPSFVPNLDGLVIVDAPVRTREAQGTSDPVALYWAQHLDGRGVDLNGLRTLLEKDSRLGLRVLYASAGGYAALQPFAKEGTPLFRYYGLLAEQDREKRLEGWRALVRDLPEGAIPTLARHLAVQDAVQLAQQDLSDAKRRERALEVAADASRSRWGLLVLEMARQVQGLGYTPDLSERILAIYQRAAELSPEFGVRYEVAQAFSNHARFPEATKRFEDAYADAMRSGTFPAFDVSLVSALQQLKEGEGTRLEGFVQRAISWAEETKNASALIVVASSLHQAGQAALAERALHRIEGTVPDTARDALEAVLARLWESWGDPGRAEALVKDLLAKPALASHAWLHDYAGSLAESQGKVSVAIAEHERALELEAARPDEVVNLSAFRQRHARLVALCAQLASANASPGVVQRGLAERILRVADRWRELDDGNPALDTEVARALLACGADDEAWDVASGAIERHPAEGAGYTAVAALYVAQGRLDFALGLYEEAAKVEPTDPTPLLEEARLLERKGEPDRARPLYERIAGKTWHERFASVLQEARAALAR